jgi:Protein of unknown function (DUF3775)
MLPQLEDCFVNDRESTDERGLSIALDKVCFVVVKAREYEVKDVVTEPDPGSNPTDDAMISVLEDHKDDPVRQELFSFIHSLNEDERIDLVALAWLGRGEGTLEDWAGMRAEAERMHRIDAVRYLLGQPLLPDLLEEGLALFGVSCESYQD